MVWDPLIQGARGDFWTVAPKFGSFRVRRHSDRIDASNHGNFLQEDLGTTGRTKAARAQALCSQLPDGRSLPANLTCSRSLTEPRHGRSFFVRSCVTSERKCFRGATRAAIPCTPCTSSLRHEGDRRRPLAAKPLIHTVTWKAKAARRDLCYSEGALNSAVCGEIAPMKYRI